MMDNRSDQNKGEIPLSKEKVSEIFRSDKGLHK